MALSYTKTQLNKMNKEDLINKFLSLQESYNVMSGKVDNLCDTVSKLENKLSTLESSLTLSHHVNSLLTSRVSSLERQLHQLEQYSRRECLEFVGVPASVTNDHLQNTVCQILKKIDVDCLDADIEACHRVKNNKTIVKFSSRRKIFLKKKQLKDINFENIVGLNKHTAIYINESLCPYYRGLWSKCKLLKSQGKIHQFWTTNGTVRMRIEEDGEVKNILHDDDLREFYSE